MARRCGWEARHQDARTAMDADQVEAAAMKYGSAVLETAVVDDEISGAVEDEPLSDGLQYAEWEKLDCRSEEIVSASAAELTRRSNALGASYPFRLQGNTLHYSGSHTLVYEFCLAVAVAESLSRGDYRKLPPAFERLARDVTVCFLGRGDETGGFRTGWPGDTNECRPKRFKDMIEELRRVSGCDVKERWEWNWDPIPGYPLDPEPRDVKDAKLDFVAWKSIPDGRPGRLFLLGQCACGESDWQGKLHELNVSQLENWLRPLSPVMPVRVFAMPFHVPNTAYFVHDVMKSAGLTLDRIRIALLAEKVENRDFIATQMKEPLLSLIQLVMATLEVVKPASWQLRKTTAAALRCRLP